MPRPGSHRPLLTNVCESTLPATLLIQPFIHNQYAHSTHSCHHKVYKGPFAHLWLFGSHMHSTLFTLQTPSSATQHRKRQGWLVGEGGSGVHGREVIVRCPGCTGPPPTCPVLLSTSSRHRAPTRSATSSLAVSNTSPEMVPNRKFPHELDCVPRTQ